MNNLRKSAFNRWKIKLEKDLEKIPRDKDSLIIKAALCGFLAGDGSVQVRWEKSYYKYQLDFFPDDDEMLKVYCKFIKMLYGLKPQITRRDNVYVARLSQKFVVIDLLKSCKFGLFTWNFPKRLFKVKGAKEYWLKAFYSAEGYVNNKVIKIQSVNIKSIKQVNKLLLELGIKGNYYTYVSKNQNHSPVGMIFINDKKYRNIFLDKIGFWHTKKMELLRQSLGL